MTKRPFLAAYVAAPIGVNFYKADLIKKLIPWLIFRFRVLNQRFRIRLQNSGFDSEDSAGSEYRAKTDAWGKHARRDLSDSNATLFDIGFRILARKTIRSLQ